MGAAALAQQEGARLAAQFDYTQTGEAQKAIEKIPGDLLRPDEMLRAALRLLQG